MRLFIIAIMSISISLTLSGIKRSLDSLIEHQISQDLMFKGDSR